MQQTNGVTSVISQEQSDLVTSATISESIKNKSIIINNNPTNINKTKITTSITSNNNSKSAANINNNNSTTTNKNNNANKTVPRSDVIVTNLQQKINSAAKNATISQPASNQASTDANGTAPLPDVRAKQVLKEAVDAVVNSFTKHTQGYGRGEFNKLDINLN